MHTISEQEVQHIRNNAVILTNGNGPERLVGTVLPSSTWRSPSVVEAASSS